MAKGIDGVKVAALSEMVGLGAGSFYHHFGTLDAFKAMLETMLLAAEAPLPEYRPRDEPWEALHVVITFICSDNMRRHDALQREMGPTDNDPSVDSDNVAVDVLASMLESLGVAEHRRRPFAFAIRALSIVDPTSPWSIGAPEAHEVVAAFGVTAP